MFGNFVDFSISPVGSTFIIVGAILAFLGIVVLLIKTLSFDMDGDILRILGIVAFLLGCFLYFYGTAKLVDDTYEHNYNAVKQDIEKESKKESLNKERVITLAESRVNHDLTYKFKSLDERYILKDESNGDYYAFVLTSNHRRILKYSKISNDEVSKLKQQKLEVEQ
ncbi:hypothetical protein [Heyndrickxia ginsengihumi]|uniref:hypothetical protein n=1 Tax=Heyndrickxia ginsengihumi TaxID=363870 RepID=UPI00046F6D9C|nr:hypothetical protein [Heyndrickxia ginsengihumi]